jgi:hypothetical protein
MTGADVVCPVCFTAAAGRLLGLDRAAAALAGFPYDMSGVIFPRMPVAFAEIGIRKSLALRVDVAELRCKSGGHLHSLGRHRVAGGVTASSMAQVLRWADIELRPAVCIQVVKPKALPFQSVTVVSKTSCAAGAR